MRVTALLLALVLAAAGCRTAGTSTRTGPMLEPIDVDHVFVATTPPPGSIEIGQVEGYGTEGFISGDDALTDAKEVAAELGADCIVVASTGTKLYSPDDVLGRRVSVVKATAFRTPALPTR